MKQITEAHQKTFSDLSRKFEDGYNKAILSLVKKCREGKEINTELLPIISKYKQIEEYHKHKRETTVDPTDLNPNTNPWITRPDSSLSPFDLTLSNRLSRDIAGKITLPDAEVLSRSAYGYTRKESAAELDLSVAAIEKRLERAYPKIAPVIRAAQSQFEAEERSSATPHRDPFSVFARIVTLALIGLGVIFGLFVGMAGSSQMMSDTFASKQSNEDGSRETNTSYGSRETTTQERRARAVAASKPNIRYASRG